MRREKLQFISIFYYSISHKEAILPLIFLVLKKVFYNNMNQCNRVMSKQMFNKRGSNLFLTCTIDQWNIYVFYSGLRLFIYLNNGVAS